MFDTKGREMAYCERRVMNCASITILERGAKDGLLERPEQTFGVGVGGVEAAIVMEDEFEGVLGLCERVGRRLGQMSAESGTRAVVYQIGDDDSKPALSARANLFNLALSWLAQSTAGGSFRIIVRKLSAPSVRHEVFRVVGHLTNIAPRSVDISVLFGGRPQAREATARHARTTGLPLSADALGGLGFSA